MLAASLWTDSTPEEAAGEEGGLGVCVVLGSATSSHSGTAMPLPKSEAGGMGEAGGQAEGAAWLR